MFGLWEKMYKSTEVAKVCMDNLVTGEVAEGL